MKTESTLYWQGKIILLIIMLITGLYTLGNLLQPTIDMMWGWEWYSMTIILQYIGVCGVAMIIEYAIETNTHLSIISTNEKVNKVLITIEKNIGLIILNITIWGINIDHIF